MTKRECEQKYEQELTKIREQLKKQEEAWNRTLDEQCAMGQIDPHFDPDWWEKSKNSKFIPDDNHWTNLRRP